jgi:hypothetical protein
MLKKLLHTFKMQILHINCSYILTNHRMWTVNVQKLHIDSNNPRVIQHKT